MILAGIVTYNPDMERFKECIESILLQVGKILVFDNASDNVDCLDLCLRAYGESIVLIKNEENSGIATGLARIMEYAYQNSYSWVLSMDQDSVLLPKIISKYVAASQKLREVGMFSCLIKDRNFTDISVFNTRKNISRLTYCITSGSMISVEAYRKTPGYDESFFIDCVDYDICYSLREKGYNIFRINRPGILHEVGHGENRYLLWKKIIIYNEKPDRVYYMTRNKVKLFRKHKEYGFMKLIAKQAGVLGRILLYEQNKYVKIKMFFKGLVAGLLNTDGAL